MRDTLNALRYLAPMPTPDTSTTLTTRCPAKLNLTLAVGAPRPDGLHPIASVMVALDFGDDLHLRRLETGPSHFTRRFADDAPKPQAIDWPIESDLVFRAHALLQKEVGHALPITCTLDKRIPAGAGLGGGSSDAAGMLVALRTLFDLPLSDGQLLSLAKALGADVTFLVHALLGQRAALVTGIGQAIEPITTLPELHCVLVFTDGSCPTPAVYRAFDQATDHPQAIADHLVQDWADARCIPPAHNDLTQAAMQVCPAIADAIQVITSLQLKPRLTGSGSALFVVVDSKQETLAIAEKLEQHRLAACPASDFTLP